MTSVKLRTGWKTLILVLFFLQSFLSTTLSQNWDWSWTWWPDFAKVIVIGYLITVHVTDTKRARLALLVIALSLGFEAAKQGWAQLILHPGAPNMNEHPMFGDNNGVALGMFMLVPVLGALATATPRFWEKGLLRFLAVGVVLRGITTYSRGGFLAAGTLGFVYIIQSKRRVTTLIATTLLAVAVLSVMPQQFWDRMRTITASDEERDASVQGRFHFWETAVRMAVHHPFAGVGFNGFSHAYDAYDVSDRAFGRSRAVHSAWFGILSEMGIPGLILFLAVLANSFLTCLRVRRISKLREDGIIPGEFARALQGSLVAYVVGASFLSAQYNEMFWHFMCLTTALKIAVTETPAAEAAPAPFAEETNSLALALLRNRPQTS